MDVILGGVKASGRPCGAMEVIRIHPHSEGEALGDWKIVSTQLLLAPSGVPVPNLNPLDVAGAVQHRIESPTREDVALAVAGAFRYPRFMLDPETSNELALEALQLRQKARLMEMMGIFRARGEP